MQQAVLDRLLNANVQFALNAKGTTNHLPMVLVALARMGATPERLQEHFDYWVGKYAIVNPHPELAVTDQNWISFVGVAEAFPSLQGYFTRWIARNGVDAVIEAVLRQAPSAPATQAFHAILRIAYGLECGNASEIAAGLGAYVATNLACEIDSSGRPAAASVTDALAHLSERFGGSTWPDGSITGKLKAIAADQAFRDELMPPPLGPGFLDEMAAAALDLYWQTADFTVLHMVTGMQAARILTGRMPADLAQRFCESLWPAMAAAYVSVGAPRAHMAHLPAETMEWDDIRALALESMDDHVIKMAYTCHAESLRGDNPLYRASAARLVRPGTP